MAHRRGKDANPKSQLTHRISGQFHWILLLVVVLLVVAIMVTTCPLNSNNINSEKNAVFADDWQHSIDGGAYSSVVLPHSEQSPIHSQIILKNKLPDPLAKGATALIRTSQQDVEVVVDDEQIYNSNPATGEAHLPSSAYHFVRMPTDSAGQTITVTLRSPYERYAGILNQIHIGSKASHIFFLLHEQGFRFVIGFLILSIGLLVTLVFLFVRGGKSKVSVIYLGAFFACAGFWFMVESRMTQFLIPYSVAITNLSIFTLTLLPVFLGLYYYSTREKAMQSIGKYIIGGVMFASLIIGVLACVDPMLPLYLLPFYLAFMIVYVIVVFLLLLVESIRSGKFFSFSVCSGVALGVFCLVELFSYLGNVKDYNQSNFLTIGVLIFCVLVMGDSIRNFAKVYQTAVKVEALTVLAYTDSLTELKNRTAFLEKLSEIEVCEERVTLAMFDINNLKLVNDTLGHLVGDAMIRHGTKAMQLSLRQEDELYRIGGDEFAAIIHHDEALDLTVLEDRMSAVLEQENRKPLSYNLSVAYGYATFMSTSDKTLLDTLARADEAMYARKKIQKGMLQAEEDRF